jgi:hypothetical protein
MDLKKSSVSEFNADLDADLAIALKKALADERPLWDNGIRKKKVVNKKNVKTPVQLDMFIDNDYLKSDWYK